MISLTVCGAACAFGSYGGARIVGTVVPVLTAPGTAILGDKAGRRHGFA